MKKIRSLLCLALVVFTAATGVAFAQGGSLTPASTPFDVGLIFYKMINRQPDFAAWVKDTPAYIQAPPENQPKMIAGEVSKLEGKFKTLDPKQSAVVVRTSVRITVKTKSGDTKKYIEIVFPSQSAVYFPYVLGGQNISVIPNGIDLYRKIPLTETEATAVSSRIDYNEMATMVVEIVPTKAEGRGPVMLDSVRQWLMIGEIGYIGFYNNYLDEIWSSQAPGYVRKGGQKIFNLHGAAGVVTPGFEPLNTGKPNKVPKPDTSTGGW